MAPEILSLMQPRAFSQQCLLSATDKVSMSAQGACSSSGLGRGAFYVPISYPFTIPALNVTLALPAVGYVDSCQSHFRNLNNGCHLLK